MCQSAWLGLCSSPSVAAAAEGTAQINRPKSTPVAPKDERTLNRTNDQKSLDTAKGPAVEDSDWEDLGEVKVVEDDYVLVYEH